MKRIFLILSLSLLASMVLAAGHPSISKEDISIKAGPTEPGEEINMLWLEAFVYPKKVEWGKVVSLGVSLTSPVKEVTASFDFMDGEIPLKSGDSLSFGEAYQIPEGIRSGVHMVRYHIKGDQGSVQRTVDFFIEEGKVVLEDAGARKVEEGEVLELQSWPLTVVSTCAALVSGGARILYAGQKVVGVSKVPFYKVLFEDQEEGWVASTMVSEPVEEYYAKGYGAYLAGSFETAVKYYKYSVTVDPDFVKGYFWLAKSYYKQGKLDAAYGMIVKAMDLDNRNMDCKAFAGILAQDYFELAHQKFRAGRFNEAIAVYQKILDLKPSSVLSWIEIGESYAKVGFPDEARSAWREALKYDPGNKDVYALLGINTAEMGVAAQPAKEESLAKNMGGLPPALADDSLSIVKEGKTGKGTKIETAIRSVVTLTKSLGTPVVEKGWQVSGKKKNFLVRYLCEQGSGVMETFEWLVDVDTRRVSANNDNARLLMSRW